MPSSTSSKRRGISRRNEAGRQRNLQKEIRCRYPASFLFKTHGSPFQQSGLPDLIGCLTHGPLIGRFFGFEVKEPGETSSAIQDAQIEAIRQAGGIACVVETFDDIVRAIDEAIRQAGSPSKSRR